jgi:hypothetical protein
MTEEHKNEFGVFEQRDENDVGAHWALTLWALKVILKCLWSHTLPQRQQRSHLCPFWERFFWVFLAHAELLYNASCFVSLGFVCVPPASTVSLNYPNMTDTSCSSLALSHVKTSPKFCPSIPFWELLFLFIVPDWLSGLFIGSKSSAKICNGAILNLWVDFRRTDTFIRMTVHSCSIFVYLLRFQLPHEFFHFPVTFLLFKCSSCILIDIFIFIDCMFLLLLWMRYSYFTFSKWMLLFI